MSSNNGHNGNGQHNGKMARKRPERAGRNGNVPPPARRFKPGWSGGPGRPKGSIDIWARIRRELMALQADGDDKGKEMADVIAKQFVKDAAAGRWPQLQELINREEGKAPDNFSGEVTIRVIREDEDDAERYRDSA